MERKPLDPRLLIEYPATRPEVVWHTPSELVAPPFHHIDPRAGLRDDRNQCGYVAVVREREEIDAETGEITRKWEELMAVPVADLSSALTRHHAELAVDSYLSVNQYYRGKPGRQSSFDPGYEVPQRQGDHLRWFTAAFADCDFYKLGLKVGDAIGWLINQQEERRIPPFSMVQRSGRGIWVYWFLRPFAREWVRHAYRRLQDSVNRFLAPIGAEAKDAARLTRIPGSRNSKIAGRKGVVSYWLQADEDGQPYSYSMEELRAFFPEDGGQPIARPGSGTPISIEWARRLRRRRFELCLAQLRDLAKHRGGIRRGHRHSFLFFVSVCLQELGYDKQRRVEELGRVCDEMIADMTDFNRRQEIADAASVHNGRLSLKSVGQALDVTPEEADYLRSIYGKRRGNWSRPKTILSAPRYGKPPVVTPRQARCLRIERRRECIREVRSSGTLSLAGIAAALRSRFGIGVSQATIHRDLRALRAFKNAPIEAGAPR